jgi:hypothetical protein
VNDPGIYRQLYALKSLPPSFHINMSRSSFSQLQATSPIPDIFHSAVFRRLQEARASALSTSLSPTPSTADGYRSHEVPGEDYMVMGERFEVDFERAFSTAGRTITCDRNSLSGSTIETLQLQKNWLRRGVVKISLTELQKHIQTVDKSSKRQEQIRGSVPPSAPPTITGRRLLW